MNQKELINQIEIITDKIIDKKYQKKYKDVIIQNYVKFLDNERKFTNKEKLLKVLKKVKWYSNHNTDIFFSNIVTEILDETIGNVFFICKNKRNSSCYSIIINLMREGKVEEDNIIVYDKKSKCLKVKKVEEDSTILVMDDYIGSGDTIINIIKAIDEKYSNKKVVILGYVWQETAIKRIKVCIKEEHKNFYNIIEKGIVLENSYKEKFKRDVDSIKYINNICDKCKDKDYKYGYMETGAMLAFDGISPNNNISMLWRNDINYNNWIPVFNREYSLEYLRKKKNEYLIKNKKEILEIYNNSNLKRIISFNEFKVLIILFNTYSIRMEYIKELLGFDNIKEVSNIIEKFEKHGIISYSTDNILEFIDTKVINEMKKVDERISANMKIIKGTRKQINKVTPLE